MKDVVLKSKTPHLDSKHPDSIDCCVVDSLIATKETGIRDNDEYDLRHYLEVTSDYKSEATFAVYDMSKLVERENMFHPYYRFREPEKKLEALLAVVKVDW